MPKVVGREREIQQMWRTIRARIGSVFAGSGRFCRDRPFSCVCTLWQPVSSFALDLDMIVRVWLLVLR